MERNFTEQCRFEGRVDLQNNRISGVAILNSISRNKRVYLPSALQSIIPLVNGCKSFIDHSSDAFGNISVLRLLGSFSNARLDNGKVKADLNVLESAQAKDLLFELAQRSPYSVGFSVACRGVIADKLDASGREQVEKIIALRSVDLVVEPAATSGLFESTQGIAEIRLENEKIKADLKETRRLLSFLKSENDRLLRDKNSKPPISKEQFFAELNMLCK